MVSPAAPRDSWATRVGFLISAIGSAVGLGNMWRFSYLASEGGGAAFLVLYLVIVTLIGIPLLTSEFVLGRLAQRSPVAALAGLAGRGWAALGALFVVGGVGILSYYAVIAGWTLRYALDAARGAIPADTGAYFGAVSTGIDALAWGIGVLGVTVWLVARGVRGGLERANVVMMPALVAILAGLAVWAATLRNGAPGYAYYLRPTLDELFDPRVLGLAAGQAFFKLSLGVGGMMTYATYLRSRTSLGREATVVALSDTAVAFVAGLVVFPVIFHFGLAARIAESTIGALFLSLPEGLRQLGRPGDGLIAAFFVMLAFAALTSAVSLLEVPVAAAVDGLGWPRARAALVAGLACVALAVPAASDTGVLAAMDQVLGNFLIIIGGLATALLAGWRLAGRADAELARGLDSVAARRGWRLLMRYVVPALLLVVLWSALGPTWQAVRTLIP